ncbi:hypothetical protein [Streptomyces sp. DT203]|uniref:hypothetical protein n=1 Tax=Streptomyces sp. DT203 TaxID=3393424 RepID=UPI003CF62FC4
MITNYSESLDLRGKGQGSGGLHIESSVWFDITRDRRTVAMTEEVSPQDVAAYGPDGSSQLDVLEENGGTRSGVMRIRLSLVNFSKAPAVINRLHARVLSTFPTPTGSAFSCGGPEGGASQSRVRLDLGDQDKVAEEYDGKEIIGQYPVNERQIAKQDEPAMFDIEVRAGREAYTFVIDVDYSQGEETGHLVVDEGGRAYKLAPVNEKATRYQCDVGTSGWYKR